LCGFRSLVSIIVDVFHAGLAIEDDALFCCSIHPATALEQANIEEYETAINYGN
jgi:hypothetical protein